ESVGTAAGRDVPGRHADHIRFAEYWSDQPVVAVRPWFLSWADNPVGAIHRADTRRLPWSDMSTSASADGGRRVNPLVAVAAALVVVTAAAAIFYGIKWIKASNDDSLGFTKARDDVARAGEQAIITFHTIDYHKAEEGLNRWIGVSTGALKDEVTGRLVASKQAIE